jgi:hypothetical protein
VRPNQGIIRPGGSGFPRPTGSGLAGRMVRPMGDGVKSRYAYAGVDPTGVVTVYERDGAIRWSATLLSGAYLADLGDPARHFHDLCFDDDAGIWIRGGNQDQLVHANAFGTITSDTAIGGTIYSSLGVLPCIAFSDAGLCYANQLNGSGDPPPKIVAHGPSGDLDTGVTSGFGSGWTGISDTGIVVTISQDEWYAWNTDGSVRFNGSIVGTDILTIEVASISRAGNFFCVFGRNFGGDWYRDTYSIATGARTDSTLLSGVTSVTAAHELTGYKETPNGVAGLVKVDKGLIFCAAGFLEWQRSSGAYVSLPGSAVSCAGFVPQ